MFTLVLLILLTSWREVQCTAEEDKLLEGTECELREGEVEPDTADTSLLEEMSDELLTSIGADTRLPPTNMDDYLAEHGSDSGRIIASINVYVDLLVVNRFVTVYVCL